MFFSEITCPQMQPNNHTEIYNNAADSIAHLKNVVSWSDVCMFETLLPEPPFHVRPMTPARITDDGALFFFSSRVSNKNHEIQENPHVQLIFSNAMKGEFLNVFGKAEIIEDKAQMQECWKSSFTEWFPLGLSDPDLTLIKITPHLINYWHAMERKMCSVIQSAIPELTATIKETLTV